MQTPLFDTEDAWIPARAEALRRMAAFVPRAGRAYAAERNFDRGPGCRANVSTLSPYLRHRVLTEGELLDAVLARTSLSAAEKFVQEVFWRTYWKGWLETHPSAWPRYLAGLAERLRELESKPSWAAGYAAAVAGQTGIDAFDTWVRELVAGNYLHNHARMWFASIWIFTLGLPWELGADLFMRHLLDGDPASNTLSWRWVAGLHTRGKTYAARRDNIVRYTEGRFVVDRTLARTAPSLDDAAIPLERPAPVPPYSPAGDAPSLLVLHDDDLHGDLRDLPAGPISGVCALRSVDGRSPLPMSAAVIAFSEDLAREAVTRAAAHATAHDLGVLESASSGALLAALAAAAQQCGATRIIAPFAPVGPARAILDDVCSGVAGLDLGYAEFGRRYDAVSWPAATRGFFNVRSRIPTILAELGIGSG